MTRRILIAGIGNVFLGDDAFGVEVVRRLAARPQPAEVSIVDFGIRGLDLTYALLDGYDRAILVDAMGRGGAPGTLYVIEPEVGPAAPSDASMGLEMHNLDPARVLRLVESMGGQLQGLLVVGCEPSPIDANDMEAGLSPQVQAVLDDAVSLVESLIRQMLQKFVDDDSPASFQNSSNSG